VRDVRARRRVPFNPAAAATAVLVSLGTTALVLTLHEWYPSRAFTFLYLPMVAVLAFIHNRGGRDNRPMTCPNSSVVLIRESRIA